MKIRKFEESNYKAIFHNGKTIRIALDTKKPITELKFPEFYDVKITSYCSGGCPYCYQDSKKTDLHYKDVIKKTLDYFGEMSDNEKPFQVALGGGNPNEHPDFIQLLEVYNQLGIMPNYTTNGIGLTEPVLAATTKYCGGVAVSCHPHLKDVWEKAVRKLYSQNVKVNLHVIISDRESIDRFVEIYKNFYMIVDYFVLLPYTAQGRAVEKSIEYEYLMEKLGDIDFVKQVAFGANFYPYLIGNKHGLNISLYEPEILSKYLDMSDMSLHKSSFNL